MSYGNLATANTQSVMEKAMSKLAQPDVCQGVQAIFALRGFTIEDAVDMHVAHIKGELTKEVVVGGEIMSLKIPPNYNALQAFEQMIIPKQTSRVAVANFNMHALVSEIESEGFAPMEARIVGQTINTDPEVEDEEEVDFGDDGDLDLIDGEDEDTDDEDEDEDE